MFLYNYLIRLLIVFIVMKASRKSFNDHRPATESKQTFFPDDRNTSQNNDVVDFSEVKVLENLKIKIGECLNYAYLANMFVFLALTDFFFNLSLLIKKTAVKFNVLF